MSYNPRDHYWFIGEETDQVYSSRRNTMVPASDEEYAAWVKAQATTPGPNTAGTVQSIEELRAIIAPLNVLPIWLLVAKPTFIQPTADTYSKEQLKEYSADRRWREEITGIVVEDKEVATDRQSQTMTQNANAYVVQTKSHLRYKFADGSFEDLTSSQVDKLAQAIGTHA